MPSPASRVFAALLTVALALPVTLAHADDVDEVVAAAPPGEDQVLDAPPARSAYAAAHVEIDIDASHPAGRIGERTAEVSGAELYLAMDRPDLAARYKRRRLVRWSLLLTTGAVAVTGLYFAVIPPAACPVTGDRYTDEVCNQQRDDDSKTRGTLGSLAAATGAALFVAAWFLMPSDPISTHQAARLSEQRNRALRRKLGVVEVSLLPVPSRSAVVTLSPSFGGDLGFSLTGAF